ncbi:MAG: hypothetical protein AABN95_17820 [Acidobacteriota bacterium]
MKALLLVPVLLLFSFPLQKPDFTGDSQVAVLGQKWSRERLNAEQVGSAVTNPAPAMIAANKNFERTRRANAPTGERDPNADTLDGRSAALEKSVQNSRQPKPVEGYTYRVKLKNSGAKVIDILFWEYQFRELASAEYLTRRQFLCGVSIKPEKEKELRGFSLSGPSDVVSVGTLEKNPQKAFDEKIVINRVEFADGTIWQRKDWKFEEIKLAYARAVNSPWAPDMCKGL